MILRLCGYTKYKVATNNVENAPKSTSVFMQILHDFTFSLYGRPVRFSMLGYERAYHKSFIQYQKITKKFKAIAIDIKLEIISL